VKVSRMSGDAPVSADNQIPETTRNMIRLKLIKCRPVDNVERHVYW